MGVVARLGVLIAVGAALSLPLALFGSQPATARTALVDMLDARVTLARGSVVQDVTVERLIQSGDTVTTDVTGHALVTYADGSTALLEEDSELTIEFVRTSASDYVVRMQQTLGRVWYAVAKTVASGGRYEVRTAGSASVIRAGSGSYVAVTETGTITVVTTAGSVDTSAGGSTVTVPAGGSTTIAGPASTPSPVKLAELLGLATPSSTPTASATAAASAQTASVRTAAPTSAPTAAPVLAATVPQSTAPPSVTSAPAVSTPKNEKTAVGTATPQPSALATAASASPTSATVMTLASKAAATPSPFPTLSTPLKDKFVPRKDGPGLPSPKPSKDG